MQEEGPQFPSIFRPLRLLRILRPEDPKHLEETIPLRRVLFWVLVWIVIFVGIVLYFEYARLLTPLLS